jgi:hypothetical protein
MSSLEGVGDMEVIGYFLYAAVGLCLSEMYRNPRHDKGERIIDGIKWLIAWPLLLAGRI